MAQVSNYFIRTRNVDNSIAGTYLVPTVLGNAVGALIGGYTINRQEDTFREKFLLGLRTNY